MAIFLLETNVRGVTPKTAKNRYSDAAAERMERSATHRLSAGDCAVLRSIHPARAVPLQ
jgi:hypothetical protein